MPAEGQNGFGEERREPRFEAFFKAEPECVKVLDSTGRILKMNPAGLGILEATSATQVVGHSIVEFIVPTYHDRIQQCFGKVLRSEDAVCEFEIVGFKGARRWVESHMVALKTVAQKMEVLAVTRDITSNRNAQIALRETEERFRLIAEHSRDVIAETTLEGIFCYISPNIRSLLGYEPEAVLGKNVLELVHPDDVHIICELLQTDRASAAYRFRDGIGGWRWLESSVCRFIASANEEERVLLVSRDITARREADAATVLLEAKLLQAQKMEALGTLAGGIAHDFNNILCAIFGNVELARMDLSPDDPAHEPLNQTLSAAARASDLVRQILAFSRSKGHERKVIGIGPVLREVAALLRAALPATIEIQTSVEPAIPSVLGDPSQIHQVLMNLATNAAHAMRRNGGVLRISLASVTVSEAIAQQNSGLNPGRFLKIVVQDTGEGMVPSTLERIFEPFFTTKPQGEGTGLGLSVVHGIVKRHDGAIFVSSEFGKGSAFEIYFPAVEEPVTSVFYEQDIPRGRGETVLFVDDEPSLCQLAERTLKQFGYTPVSVPGPSEALVAFERDPLRFAAIVTDLTMPKMTGLDLALKIKSINTSVPIILITGFTGGLTHDSLRAHGIDGLLAKPFTVQALAQCLHKMIGAR